MNTISQYEIWTIIGTITRRIIRLYLGILIPNFDQTNRIFSNVKCKDTSSWYVYCIYRIFSNVKCKDTSSLYVESNVTKIRRYNWINILLTSHLSCRSNYLYHTYSQFITLISERCLWKWNKQWTLLKVWKRNFIRRLRQKIMPKGVYNWRYRSGVTRRMSDRLWPRNCLPQKQKSTHKRKRFFFFTSLPTRTTVVYRP